ncbi:hypothetical protein JOB18_045624 [Solea senegalensis]|uniref:Uncharacterized protein n=1 Tax=Solea senegalensis TaxID=28829 RepID=A0AAV6RB99_SOLSE|nr:hypothetical protein JOB18_045624 [Solea senegalensis]
MSYKWTRVSVCRDRGGLSSPRRTTTKLDCRTAPREKCDDDTHAISLFVFQAQGGGVIMESVFPEFIGIYGFFHFTSQSQDYDFPTPGYDDNTSLSVSFFSNTSFEELEKLSERFIDAEEEDEDFLYGDGWTEEQEVTVTTATTRGTTESGVVDGRNAASLPVSLEISTLVWILMMVISVNLQQLQHTL